MKTLQCTVVTDQLKGPEEPQDPQGTKGAEIQGSGEVKRQDGQQVDDPVKTENIPEGVSGHVDPQHVFNGEDYDAEDFKIIEETPDARAQVGEGIHGKGDQGKHDQSLDRIIEYPAFSGGIVLHDIPQPLSHWPLI
jgi:hypothetical protein